MVMFCWQRWKSSASSGVPGNSDDHLKMRDLELVHILATPRKVEVAPSCNQVFLRERPVVNRSDPREIIGCGDLRNKQEPVLSKGRALLNCQNQGVRRPLCPSATAACSIARCSLISDSGVLISHHRHSASILKYETQSPNLGLFPAGSRVSRIR